MDPMRDLRRELVSLGQKEPIRVEVVNGPEDGRSFPLKDEETRIGRHEDCEVQIVLDRSVSRMHARITRPTPQEFEILDVGSTHGTSVNGIRIQQNTPIRPGDIIQVGDTELMLLAAEEEGQ